jgi:GDPmannose 4,6-dehydratase
MKKVVVLGSKMKSALVIGGTGMDGNLMVALLLTKGYRVTATYNNSREKCNIIHHYLTWVKFDLATSLDNSILKFLPCDEVYNFAGVSFSPDSIRMPDYCELVNEIAVRKMLEVITFHSPKTKFFQASSGEVFGYNKGKVNLNSPRDPQTPYAVAKNNIDMLCKYLREEGYLIYNGISFSHERHTRDNKFLIKKVCRYVAELTMNLNYQSLTLGGLDNTRDWGSAVEYVAGFYSQMQGEPSELIFATGKLSKVQEVLEIAFGMYGYNWYEFVRFSDDLKREDGGTYGDYSEAEKRINFKPTLGLKEIIEGIIVNEIEVIKNEKL